MYFPDWILLYIFLFYSNKSLDFGVLREGSTNKTQVCLNVSMGGGAGGMCVMCVLELLHVNLCTPNISHT